MEEEVQSLRCKEGDNEGRHKDGLSIDMRGDVFINRVEGVKEGVSPIDPYSTSIKRGGGSA